MNDRLYGLYENELQFIREEVQEYGGLFAKIAKRLDLSPQSTDLTGDPHVTRLIDSFALLMARLRLKLEDEFPDICQAMLSVLYPQYLAPVPSTAIVQFQTNATAAELATGIRVPRGAELETEEVRGAVCRYRTCCDTQVLPIRVVRTEYLKPPFAFPTEQSWADQAEAAIRIVLESQSDKLDWAKTHPDQLRFYLGGTGTTGNRLFEAILRDALGLGWYSDKAKSGRYCERTTVQPLGMSPTEALLQHDPRTQASYRLLWEFFVLREKFRFVSVDTSKVWSGVAAPNLNLVVFLRRRDATLERSMSPDAIQLGCAPIINLFQHEAEPIQLTENQVEYRVIPSHRHPRSMEVHTVRSVIATRSGGEAANEFFPFYEPSHRMRTSDRDRYWHASRRRRVEGGGDAIDRGTEVYLSIVDLHSRPIPEEDWTLHVKTLCCNRDAVNDLGSKSRLLYHGGPLTAKFLSAPTPTLRPVERDDWVWRLISHLSLNHLTLVSDSEGKLLKEILSLYNFQDRDDVRKAIEAIRGIRYERTTARLVDPNTLRTANGPGICRGFLITMDVDEEPLEGLGIYLFSSILDHFFAAFATINSFTRLRVRTRGSNQIVYDGPPRCGTKILL